MKNPATISDHLAAKLEAIPALAEYMVEAYHDDFPAYPNALKAITNLGASANGRAMLVVYQGSQWVRRQEGWCWVHGYSIYIIGSAYETLMASIVNGVPAGGDGQKLLNTSIDPDCDLMDAPKISRMASVEAHDMFRLDVNIPEIGDN